MNLSVPFKPSASASPVAAFIRLHRAAIVARWYDSMKDRPVARGLSHDQLVNHVPELLDAIAAADEARADDPGIRLATESAETHAVERLGDGFDLDHVVIELAVLRDCVLDTWDAEGLPLGRDEIRFLNRSIDRAMAAAVQRYGAARDRTLLALDRVAAAAASSRDLDDLLQRLLEVLVQTMPAVESGAILLREGEALTVRATAGLYRSIRHDRVPLGGRGLAVRVALAGQPLQSSDGGDALDGGRSGADASVLHALPLVENRVVMGVVELRSMPGCVFGDADERLFAALASRAASTILQHMLRDTAERRAAELDGVLKSVPDAIVVTYQGRIRLQNPAARELFGLEAERATERHGWLAGVEPRALGSDVLQPVEAWPVVVAERSGRPHVDDLVLRHGSTGREVTVRMFAAPVRYQPGSGAVVVVCTDITERRRIEAEREQLVAALRETLQDREHVLAVVAHDLRSPLTTLGLAAHALAVAGPDSEIGPRAVGTIERSTHRMERLIQDLLDASSIRAGRLALSLEPMSPQPILSDVADAFAVRAAEKGLELRVDTGAGLPLIRGDHERLVQALSNLLGNAVKVCAAGRVGLSVEATATDVVFSVSDTGPGIDDELQEAIFEPFRRGNAAYSGTGLGLAICRGIAEGHGGRVWVESVKGAGATFRLSVPVLAG